MPDDPLNVSYPVAALLDRMDAKIDARFDKLAEKLGEIDAKLDAKAERAELEALREKNAAHDGRIATLERIEENRDKGAENRRANVALWISGIAAVAAVLAVVVTLIAGAH